MSERTLTSLTGALARQILMAMGLSATLAAGAAGCSGKAVVDGGGGEGSGGEGSTSTSTSGTTTTTTTTSTTTTTTTTTSVTPGRPFTVGGEVRGASECARRDWLADAVSPQLHDLDDSTRRRLAAAWTADGIVEHAAVASFARFVLELNAVGAPADLVRQAGAALLDEVRHAELCFALAAAYGGEPVGPGSFPIEGGLDERLDLAAVAVATVHEGCVNETLSGLAAAAAGRAATDPAVRAALEEIARDEWAHAELAWRFVAWACERDARTEAAVTDAFAAALEGPGMEIAVANQGDDGMRHHGRLGARERAEVVRAGMNGVIAPCARALLARRRHPSVPLECAPM